MVTNKLKHIRMLQNKELHTTERTMQWCYKEVEINTQKHKIRQELEKRTSDFQITHKCEA